MLPFNTKVELRVNDKESGESVKKEVNCPQLVKDYNAGMGGVDLSDQLINKYNILMKTNKWWKILFFHLIDISVVNAYILYKQWLIQNPGLVDVAFPGIKDKDNFSENIRTRYQN